MPKTILSIILIVVVTIYNHYWLLSQNLFFYADDWGWLQRAEFYPIKRHISFFPLEIYCDRPVGALMIIAIYKIFGLNYLAFAWTSVLFHMGSCLLIYFFAKKHISNNAALISSIIASTWTSCDIGVGWLGTIFDIMGATLFLASLLLFQLSLQKKNDIVLNLLGAMFYLLAVRTKEFALPAVLIFVFYSLIYGEKNLKLQIKKLFPYFLIFLTFVLAYLNLYFSTYFPPDHQYKLGFSLLKVFENILSYLEIAFYFEIIKSYGLILSLLIFIFGIYYSERANKKFALFCIISSLLIFGPTLFFSNRTHPLYIYASHFFFALAIGCVYSKELISRILCVISAIFIFLIPQVTNFQKNLENFTVSKLNRNKLQFESVVTLTKDYEANTTYYISGLEPYFNIFSHGKCDALKVIKKDESLNCVIEKSEGELTLAFCRDEGEKKFFNFDEIQLQDITQEKFSRCKS